jgi:hypothetical protein
VVAPLVSVEDANSEATVVAVVAVLVLAAVTRKRNGFL